MIYEFYCKKCKKDFEVEIPIDKYDDEKEKQKCPECGEKLKRHLIFNGGIEFKGPGFFNTDNNRHVSWS